MKPKPLLRSSRGVGWFSCQRLPVPSWSCRRIFAQVKLIEFFHHDAHRAVHRLNHTAVDRAVLHLASTETPVKNKPILGQAESAATRPRGRA